MRFFNIAGPCIPGEHYMVPAGTRCGDLKSLVMERSCFVIHAPRQTGKTTLIQDFVRQIGEEGNYYGLYCSLETAQGISEVRDGMRVILSAVQDAVHNSPYLPVKTFDRTVDDVPETVLKRNLAKFCRDLDKPLVIMFDEVDCLADRTLISFLRQLRQGYVERAVTPFVHALALVGMRNIRDYKAMLREGRDTLGSASPFNIVTEALTIRNFSRDELALLLQQHAEATGQVFTETVVNRMHERSGGQPWLCNALAREITVKLLGRDTSKPITLDLVDRAEENIIMRRDTHIDSLLERLKEPRVRRIMEPVILGNQVDLEFAGDDASYVFDLGLLIKNMGDAMPANPIYGEVIIRALTFETQFQLPTTLAGRFMANGHLDMTALLKDFQQFWRQNSDIWLEKFDYKEAAPHLILQAFLQRVVNGGGSIDREYSAGRGRIDLCVGLGEYRYPIELKIRYGSGTREKGLDQLAGYMNHLGLREGWLIIFERDPGPTWEQKISWETRDHAGKTIHIVGC
ncbi:MAG: AAA-like domain-containing protein [Acidobacteriota bacterium]|nr:AAA-like domain-containing protein [Acidobacteriota bacterium]